MAFNDDMYEVVKNGIPKPMLKFLITQIEMMESSSYYMSKDNDNPFPFGDDTCPRSFARYGSYLGDTLVSYMKDTMSSITNKSLCETYSYLRVYYNKSTLRRHKDRPSCEYSATLCLKKDHNWPIGFKNLNGDDIEIELEAGDFIVYKGDILEHWRNEYTGNRHIQIFLHYIDMNGPNYPTYKYDQRHGLGLPASTTQ